MKDQLYLDLSDDTLSRINRIENVADFDLAKVEKGLLSVHARWSAQSISHGRSILKLLDNSILNDVEIYIIDIDDINPNEQIDLFNAECHGYFESVWIENGEIEFKYCDKNLCVELSKFMDFLKKKINKAGSNA